MNPVLHGTLKNVFTFVGNLFFWPLSLLFLSISGWGQAGAAVGVTLVVYWIAKGMVIAVVFPAILYVYLATGLVTALVFSYLFGTFRNWMWTYPMLGVMGIWLGIALSLI